MAYKLSLGTVSHGTLRLPDLLVACAKEIEYITDTGQVEPPRDYQSVCQLWAEANGYADQLEDHPDTDATLEETAQEHLDACIDLLNEYCPPFCYFGMHEGDGSDLGCWPAHDAIDEAIADGTLVTIKDPNELDGLDDDTEGAVFINDHGNMTIYQPARTWKPVVEAV